MAFSYSRALFLAVIIGSMLGASMANRDWSSGWGWNWGWGRGSHHHPNATVDESRKVIIGGSENWRFNFSYSDWALKNGPFFVNDTLVFKYDPPSDTNTHPHSVYLLPDLWSFKNCNISKGKLVANEMDGAGDGFEFVLKEARPYFFACGASNGFHCNVGLMKFPVFPLLRWHY